MARYTLYYGDDYEHNEFDSLKEAVMFARVLEDKDDTKIHYLAIDIDDTEICLDYTLGGQFVLDDDFELED